ncbi:hypothetical protein pdam_00017132 [Pocillopora damicornis]|uniref:Uncharacterized protein n=1 Tax=Pocillopora damicornis TaxID=46731 RepID=A0A3M6U4V5_POCDA|nr:hypothetical protein pdam_00017132 [Pocillopora damicornis]
MATQLNGIVPCCFTLSGIQIVYLNPSNRSNVDDLRKFRNKEFAHMPRSHLFDRDFQKKLDEVLRKVDELKQELKEKKKELLEKDKELLEEGTKQKKN